MAELLVGFIVLAIIFTFVTLIGHGLWLMSAAILRALFGIGTDETGTAGYPCPECRNSYSLVNGRCKNCGYHTVAKRRAELDSLIELIRRLHGAGRIADRDFEGIMPALQQESQLLRMANGLDPRYQSPPVPSTPPAPPRYQSAAEPPLEIRDDETPRATGSEPQVQGEEVLDAEVLEIMDDAPTPPPAPAAVSPFQQATHPLDAPDPEPAVAPPAAATFSPRRTMADMLQGFMEEKNIRWGELASGMLIVGSAIGLVISLRTQLEQLSQEIPYLPALLLMLGTVAIHAAGLYTLRRWKLRSTSRGVLIIATLLVPLSFVAGIMLSGTGENRVAVGSPFYIAAVLIGMLGYGTVTSLSARALFPEGWWRLTVAVMGASAGQLVINRLANRPAPTEMLFATGLFALPLVSYLIATLLQLRAMSAKQHLTPIRAAQTFTVLGIASFSLAVPLGLQAGISESVRGTIEALSPSLSIAAAVVLSMGIAVQRRCESRRMGETRMVGTALALLGGMMMLGTVFAAWPDPTILIAVATVTAITLATLAVVSRLPVLHAGAVAAASFAGLLLFHHAAGHFDMEGGPRGRDLLRAILMGRSAIVLLAPTLLAGLVGLLLVQQQRMKEGLTFLASAAGIATTSLVIAFYAGFWTHTDVNWTTPIFMLYAVGTLTLVPILKRQAVTWAGAAALLVALIHLLCLNTWLAHHLAQLQMSPARPLLLAMLIHGLLVACYGLTLHVVRLRAKGDTEDADGEPARVWLNPLPLAGALTAALTVPFVLYVPATALGDHGAYAACVTVVWAIAAGMLRDPRLATAAQTAATVAIAFATAAFAVRQDWPDGLQDFRHWQLQLSVLALWCLLGTAVRLLTQRWPRVHELFKPDWPTVDQLLLGALVAGIVGAGVRGCWTGILVELGVVGTESAAATDIWHVVAYGSGSWVALSGIVGAILLLLYEQVTVTRLAGLVIATAAVPLLVAGTFEDSHAVASALRWSFAIYTFLWIAGVTFREQIQHQLVRVFRSATELRPAVARTARDLATLLGVVPVALLTTAAVIQASQGATFNGPVAESLFGRLSESVLYATPLALLVVGFLVIAVRDGSTLFAFLGSLLLQYFVALAVLLPTLSQGVVWSTAVTVTLAQWTACSLAAYALVWSGLSRWIDRHTTSAENWPFQFQIVATATASLLLAAWALGPIFFAPSQVDSVVDALGLWPSYLAAALATLAAGWHFRGEKMALAVLGIVAPCVFVTLAAATSNAHATPGNWLAYHLLTGGYLAIALAAAAISVWQRQKSAEPDWFRYFDNAPNVIALGVFALLVRGCIHDPIAAWWTVGMSAGLMIFIAAQGILARQQAFAYASAVVATFATTVVWCHLSRANNESFLAGLVFANVLVASLVALAWLVLDIWHQRTRSESWDPQFPLITIQTFVAIAGTAIMALLVVGGAAISITAGLAGGGTALAITDAWGLGALLALGLLLVALLWEQHFGLGLVAGYMWGYVAMGLLLNLLQQTEVLGPGRVGACWLVVGAGISGAAYVALTGHGWKWGANIANLALRVHVPQPVEKLVYISRWLPAFNLIVAGIICGLGFLTIFSADDRAMRVTVAFAPLLLAYGVSCLAQQQRKFAMQSLALFLVVVGAIFIGWADISAPSGQAAVLAYCARLLVVLAGMTLLYSLVVVRWIGETSSWFDAVRRSSVILAATTAVVLAGVLMLEVALFEKGVGAPIATPEVIAISVMLFGFLVALLSMAVLPGRDPLALTEKGRQGYVYAAQATAALLFAHIYLAKPELFQLGILEYWPYIVMCIAFASVAFAEFCFRKGWRVIAEPMQRTGGFLPLLPALTAWTFATESSYPLTLFFAGLIYVFMSVSRRSFVAGIAAAVMGNGALWALFVEQGLQLTTQPQLWMIPPALSVLGASYINRDRLSDNTLTAIRYICVMIIYLSSTGEMFMKLLPKDANDWVRPLILTSLSVGGIFAGIMLRVRAFLYLGSSFLLLSIVAMVWNAQRMVGHTWPWWVFGITLGLVILVIFGLFERYRQEVQQLVSRLRQWQP